MQIIGLTGGSGTGKSTVLAVLETMGAKTIDCDALYHKLLAENRELLAEILARFPQAAEDGGLNRKALGKIVFEDKEALSALNAITHKYVIDAVKAQIEESRAAGLGLLAIEAIALVESGLAGLCTVVVAVLAKKEDRMARIVRREGIGEDYAKSRIESQQEDGFFIAHADIILENQGTQKEFGQKTLERMAEILKKG